MNNIIETTAELQLDGKEILLYIFVNPSDTVINWRAEDRSFSKTFAYFSFILEERTGFILITNHPAGYTITRTDHQWQYQAQTTGHKEEDLIEAIDHLIQQMSAADRAGQPQ